MTVRVAINGFGRIGRSVFRIGMTHPEIDFVAINDLADSHALAHLLKYDSMQGVLMSQIKGTERSVIIDGKEIPTFLDSNPDKLPWKELAVDVVLESTGIFTRRDEAYRHIRAGAHKVVISEPGYDPDVTIIPGINNITYNKGHHYVVSMGSCTANCLAPIAKILDDEFGIICGHMTTVHSYTGNQALLDNPHKDIRRARAMAESIIPTTTTAIEAVGRVIPRLAGRLRGIAVRVPTPKVALIDFVAALSRKTSKEEVNNALMAGAAGPLKGILWCTEDPLVSSDLEGNPYSSVVDLDCTQIVGGNMVKIIAWYDNEWGFSNRLCELFSFIADVARPNYLQDLVYGQTKSEHRC
jgi:glyceraldehyde 3-phosphate dehydrogenase